MRKKRTVRKNELLLICEGSTTEYLYFKDVFNSIQDGRLKSPYTNIKILPCVDNYIQPSGDRPVRHMMGNASTLTYYEKSESSQELYDKYKGQPSRYVREAELFVEEDGFDEGWAIYDKDHHPNHGVVPQMLEENPNIHVAFSSYSFEQWLLTHFERYKGNFTKSECVSQEGKSLQCGKVGNYSEFNCHGNICLAGRLRELKYIPEYEKTSSDLFSTFTLTEDNEISFELLFNASWLRSKTTGNRFDSDAYTDVDVLVRKILGDCRNVYWPSYGEIIQNAIIFDRVSDIVTIENISQSGYFLNKVNIQYVDSHASFKGDVIESNLYLSPGDVKEYHLDFHYPFLCYKEGYNYYIFEISANS